jgi:diaminopropionate ammonia-lyase
MPEELVKNAFREVGSAPAIDSTREPLAFHRKLPGYAPTPLRDSPALAERLGAGRVLVKIESSRLGLPAFKMLGASWGTYRALVARLGAVGEREWSTIDELRAALDPLRPLRLAAATDGNHGRAVARMAKLLGFDATIFVPDDMAQARIDAIRSEGADVEIVAGTYDDAVARSAALESDRCVVVSDTSWPGYEETPRRVIEGYATIFAEIDDALGADDRIDVVFLPAGVGALAAAGVAAYGTRTPRPTLVSVEPADAACVLESVRAGTMTEVPGPHRSIMVGLNCGNASLIAFPVLLAGLDWSVAIGDGRAESAMRLLDADGIVAGETGAASLAGALGVIELGGRDLVGLTPDATVLLIVTEGATDPVNYEQIVGHPPR